MTAHTKCLQCGKWVQAFSPTPHGCKPSEDDLTYRLRKRAEIRRQIPGRKSVESGEPDRIADLLDEAADRIAELERQLNNGGNPEVINTKLQDARTSLESTQPYAYAVVQGEDGRENVSLQFDHPEMCGQQYKQAIPLFTTPQTKRLSDEEILEVIRNESWRGLDGYLIKFARAIEERHGIK